MHSRSFRQEVHGRYAGLVLAGVAVSILGLSRQAAAADGAVEFKVVDSAGEPLPCRIHLLDSEGKPRFPNNLPSPRGNGFWTQEIYYQILFFLDWIDERIGRIPNKLDDPDKLAEVLAVQESAKVFWQDKLAKANAD
jgi:hypothetical protein